MKASLSALLLSVALATAPARACSVALALLIDVSGSVDPGEYALQMDGLAEALADGLVAEALIAEKAAVAVVQWSGKSRQELSLPWARIATPEDAEALSRAVATLPRAWRNYSTGIGEALTFAANLFAQVPDCRRKVIDVSGDGRSNEGTAPEDIAPALAAAGFEINGLAIETDDPQLAEYYREKVVAGPRAFVITATGYDDYPEQIRRKLIREVTRQVATR